MVTFITLKNSDANYWHGSRAPDKHAKTEGKNPEIQGRLK